MNVFIRFQRASLFVLLCASVFNLQGATVFPVGSTWKYFIGTSEASPADITLWREAGFDDSSWSQGATPIGYGEGGMATTLRTSSSAPAYTSVYLRKTFTVADPAAVAEITLDASCDDGYVAWINGVELGRINVPSGDLLFNSVASTAGETVTTTFTLANASSALVAGENVVAVHFFNANTTSSDLLFNASLTSSVDDQPPVLANHIPNPGSIVRELFQVEVFFNEPVTNVDAADLLINGVPTTNMLFVNPSQYLFEFPQPPTGSVSVAFASSHGIVDLTPLANPFDGGNWNYTLNPNAPVAGMVINEFMANNDNGIRDEDGDRSDWIELFNGSDVPVDLAGWFLTDDGLNLTKWRLPDVVILANGYLLVFASSKDRTNSGAALHANFSLGNGGEFLALVDRQTNIVSSFAPAYPPQEPDISYGRDRVDPTIVGYYSVPTPLAPNATTGADVLPEVRFSRSSSTFVTPFDLELSVDDTNAIIRFVLVNSPTTASTNVFLTASSPIYTNAIPITGTVQVRARAFPKSGTAFPGPLHSENYIQLNPNVLNFSSDLPLIIIHDFGQGAYPQSQAEFNSVVAVFEPGEDRSSLTNLPVLTTRAGVNLRGSSTLGYQKGSFAVEFWNEFTDDTDKSLLGMPEESDWVFYAPNNFEPVLFHNPLYYQLSRDVGRYAPRTRFAEVFLNTGAGAVGTNHYNGVYVIAEKIKRADGRVNISRLDPEDTNAPAVTGGYLLSIDRVDPNERTFTTVGFPGVNMAGQGLIYVDPSGPAIQTPQRDPQEKFIANYLNTMITNLASATYTNVPKIYERHIDVDSWIDHIQIACAAYNVDAMRLSGFLFKDRDKRVEFGPVWDCDRCMGSTDGRDFQPRTWTGSGDRTDFFNVGGSFANPWYQRLFRDIDFWQKYVDRYQQLRDGPFHLTNINARIDQYVAELAEAQPREFARWRVQPRGPNGSGAGTYATEVQWKKNWFAARMDFMDTNFLNRPRLNAEGGMVAAGTTVTLTPAAKAGSYVIYTLDGTDPRLPHGQISSVAFSNQGPVTITITNNVRIFARSFNSAHRNVMGVNNPPLTTPWSGTLEATFVVATPPLRITEIMYHPQPPPAGNTNDADNYEYLEVKNIGSTPLNVNRFRLRAGVDFDFPNVVLAGGQAAVIVKDQTAFQSRYGTDALILGVYTNDNLANATDHLILEGGLREPILDFSYSDEWYPITDGAGFSLQIVNENAARDSWGLKESWRPSGVENGTPGIDDPGAPSIASVVVNEVLTHTDLPVRDAIELHNLGDSPADISHWWLTDDFDSPRKYRIPPNTMIPSGGYIVFDESQFNTGADSFSFSSQGDDVYLFSGNADGDLTGYFHGFDFGAQFNGVTFGRHVISTGGDHLVAQISNTLSNENSGPRIGPVVISEVNYHPVDIRLPRSVVDNTEDEYIELQNITDAPVPLYHPTDSAFTWHLRDAVDYQFPATNVVLAPNELILVVSFIPTNGPQLAAFKIRSNVPEGIRIFGPWEGQLDNLGDSVELARPDAPQPTPVPFAPSVLVDKVNYNNVPPWASGADGLGPSLQRILATAYGNDPSNWVAGGRSPGLPYVNVGLPSITQHPQSETNIAFDPVMLSVVADGPGPLTYQWRHNGMPISGATGPILVIPSVLPSQEGVYDVIVLNPSGAVSSEPATLTLLTPIRFTTQPQSITPRPGSNVTFSAAVVSAAPPVRYQWFFNGSMIAGATNPTHVVNSAGLANQGSYYVMAVDGVKATNSAVADLVLWINPVISIQPLPQDVPFGGTATFSVTVSNTVTQPLGFRWRRAGATTAFFILNDYTSVLTVPNVTNETPVSYTVVITNAPNTTGILSATAPLRAIADRDGDGIPDEAELALGLDPDNPNDAEVDTDGDTMLNLEEYIAGTIHTNALSYLKVDRLSAPGSAVIEFSAVSNRTYSVLFTDSLGANEWSKLNSVSARTTNYVGTVVDSEASPARIYRLVTPAQP